MPIGLEFLNAIFGRSGATTTEDHNVALTREFLQISRQLSCIDVNADNAMSRLQEEGRKIREHAEKGELTLPERVLRALP